MSRFAPVNYGRDALHDALSITTEVFDQKISEYLDTHRGIRIQSVRVYRGNFLKESILHKAYLKMATRMAARQTKTSEKPGGTEALIFIRDQLISSGEEYRRDPKPSRRQPKIGLLVNREDMLDESIMGRKWRHQKTYLRVVAAEIEAMAVALYIDHKLLERKLIEKRDKITKDSLIWKFSRLSERNLDIIRHLYVS